jgi:hypothetical protein
MDTSRRRPRTVRTPTGKRLALTERDLEIFRALDGYRYLRSTHLFALAGGKSETRFKERLGDLFHEGFLDRPEQQWEMADARYLPAVYELGERARRVLRQLEPGGTVLRTYLSHGAHRQFVHSLLTCECLTAIEIAARAEPNLRFIPWSEILKRAPERTRTSDLPFRIPASAGLGVIPDALFGLEYRSGEQKTYRFFALEADRGTMPVARSDKRQTSYLGKLAAYREIRAKGLPKSYLGVSTLFVLTLTTSPARVKEIMSGFLEEGREDPCFLFKAIGSDPRAMAAPAAHLLREPWQRAGETPLVIAGST